MGSGGFPPCPFPPSEVAGPALKCPKPEPSLGDIFEKLVSTESKFDVRVSHLESEMAKRPTLQDVHHAIQQNAPQQQQPPAGRGSGKGARRTPLPRRQPQRQQPQPWPPNFVVNNNKPTGNLTTNSNHKHQLREASFLVADEVISKMTVLRPSSVDFRRTPAELCFLVSTAEAVIQRAQPRVLPLDMWTSDVRYSKVLARFSSSLDMWDLIKVLKKATNNQGDFLFSGQRIWCGQASS